MTGREYDCSIEQCNLQAVDALLVLSALLNRRPDRLAQAHSLSPVSDVLQRHYGVSAGRRRSRLLLLDDRGAYQEGDRVGEQAQGADS